MEAKQSSTKGRQRVPMVMISDTAARHVCFTKRRKGLFKKVCELSTLCGADSLTFVTSTAGKLYSIGTPDVPKAVERFIHMYCGELPAVAEQPLEDAKGGAPGSTNGHDRQLLEKLHQEIDVLEKKSDESRELRSLLLRSLEEKAGRLPHGWGVKLVDLPTQELEEMMVVLRELLVKVGVDMPDVVGEEGVNRLIGARSEAPAIVAPMNMVGPPNHYASLIPVPPRPQATNTSSFVASVGSSALLGPGKLLALLNRSGFKPSTVLAQAHSWNPPSTLYSAALVAPSMAVNPMSPSSSCFTGLPALPPTTTPDMNPSNSVSTSGIPMTSSARPVPPPGRLASWNPSALSPPVLPAPSGKMSMSEFTDGTCAPMICSVAPENPSTFPSAAALPIDQQLNTGGGTIPPTAGYVKPPAAVAPPLRVVNNGAAPESVGGESSNAGGEFCASEDALPSSVGASWEFFDIPRDFDFARDWPVY